MLTHERLKQVLHYDPSSGRWTRMFCYQSRMVGEEAGSIHPKGYRYLKVDGVSYKSNRLAFFYMTGEWPSDQIDHENLGRADDKWENLREATQSQNKANCNAYKTNKSGFKGVYFSTHKRRWVASIQVNKKRINLGAFDSPESASEAYALAAEEHFGQFARAQ